MCSILRGRPGTPAERRNERLSPAIILRPLVGFIFMQVMEFVMRLIPLALGLMAACAATAASAETVNLTGTYRCIQMCRDGMIGAPTLFTQKSDSRKLRHE